MVSTERGVRGRRLLLQSSLHSEKNAVKTLMRWWGEAVIHDTVNEFVAQFHLGRVHDVYQPRGVKRSWETTAVSDDEVGLAGAGGDAAVADDEVG